MGEIFKGAVEARGKTFKSEKQLGLDMEGVVLEECFEEWVGNRENVCMGLYACGYVGCGGSSQGRRKKVQMPKTHSAQRESATVSITLAGYTHVRKRGGRWEL